jgi:hypothetical protein
MLWVDIRMLNTYIQLRNSGTFVSHHHLVPAFTTLAGFDFTEKVLPNIAREYRQSIKPMATNPLETLGIYDVDDSKIDPFQDCPVCAFVPSDQDVSQAYHMAPSVKKQVVEQFHEKGVDPARAVHSIQTDCCTKAVRLNVGAENLTLDTDDFVYFGDALSTIPQAASEAKYDSDMYACTQQIVASRAPGRPKRKATEKNKTVEQTLAAMVCKHEVCLRKSLRASKDPEHFGLYHIPLIQNILSQREPLNVCLDDACQCGPSFEKRHKDEAEKRPWMRWRTGSWHEAAHDSSCRCVFAMNFRKGAGTCDGEGTEKLWASLRPLWSTSKYMEPMNFYYIVEARNVKFPEGHSGTLVNHCRRIFEDFFPDRALRDNPPDINLDELAYEWCGTADLMGDARFRAPKRSRHSCVRFGWDSEGKVDVGQTNLLKMAVRFLKETLKGYAAIEARTPGYCTLYGPFASRCFIALTWLGFATYTDYVAACRDAASRTSRSPWVSSPWINQEFVYANLVTSPEVRECMREDNVFLNYARMVNPFDPCISAPLWKEYRGVEKAINVVCSPPRDVIDTAFFFFSKRVSHFAAFLIPETFLKR